MALRWASVPMMVVVLLVLLAGWAAVVGQQTIFHAEVRHGGEATMARECADRPEFRFFNMQNNRWALVCLTSSGKWGVVILDELGREITAFLKNKMDKLDEVIRYLNNRNYFFPQ